MFTINKMYSAVFPGQPLDHRDLGQDKAVKENE